MGALTGLGPAGNACVIAPLVLAGAYGLLRARRVHPERATLATLGAETIDPADRPDPRPENPTPDHHRRQREG